MQNNEHESIAKKVLGMTMNEMIDWHLKEIELAEVRGFKKIVDILITFSDEAKKALGEN